MGSTLCWVVSTLVSTWLGCLADAVQWCQHSCPHGLGGCRMQIGEGRGGVRGFGGGWWCGVWLVGVGVWGC